MVQRRAEAASPVLLLRGVQQGLYSPCLSPVAPLVTSTVGPSAQSVLEQWHNCSKLFLLPTARVLFVTTKLMFNACLANTS